MLFLASSPAAAGKSSGKPKKSSPAAKTPVPARAAVKEPDPSQVQGPMMPVFQGPPAPPVLRAAGVCMQFEPGVFIVLAEVGGSGKVFRLDANTALEVKPQRGGRLRILYVDGIDGPVARKVMQGPVEVKPVTPQPSEPPR